MSLYSIYSLNHLFLSDILELLPMYEKCVEQLNTNFVLEYAKSSPLKYIECLKCPSAIQVPKVLSTKCLKSPCALSSLSVLSAYVSFKYPSMLSA